MDGVVDPQPYKESARTKQDEATLMYSFTICVLAVLPTALFFVLARLERGTAVPPPTFILGWTLLFGYTLKGLYLAYTLNSDLTHRLAYFGDKNLDLGAFATVYGVMAFLVGYLAVGKTRLRLTSTSLRLHPTLTHIFYYGLFCVSLILMMTFFWKMGFLTQVMSLQLVATKYFVLEQGDYATSLGFLTMGGDFLLILALYYAVFTPKLKALNVYTFTAVFLFLCYFLSSRRNAVLIMIIAFLMVRGIRKAPKKVGRKFARIVLVGVVLATLSFASQIRGRSEVSAKDLDLLSALEISAEHTLRGAYFMDISKTAAIITETKRRDVFQLGQSYTAVVFAPIPRVLWPGKPAIRNSYFVGDDLLDLRSKSGAPPSGIAELYMNFGWLGIGLGMLLVGGVIRLAYNNYLAAPDKRFARVPYAITMLCLVLFMLADFGMAVLFFIRYAIAIFVCHHYWMSILSRRQSDIPLAQRSLREKHWEATG